MSSPTQHSLALLRRSGYQAAVVEKWLPRVNLRSDLWHFGDLLAVSDRRDPRFLIVQCTSASNVSSRLAKAKGCPELLVWLRAGGAFQVHGWGQRNGKPAVKVVEVQVQDLAGVVVQKPPRRRGGKGHQQRELFDGQQTAQAVASRPIASVDGQRAAEPATGVS